MCPGICVRVLCPFARIGRLTACMRTPAGAPLEGACLHLHFGLLTQFTTRPPRERTGFVAVPIAMPLGHYEMLDPSRHGWTHPWCTFAYMPVRSDKCMPGGVVVVSRRKCRCRACPPRRWVSGYVVQSVAF
jgi:hypothetical protein